MPELIVFPDAVALAVTALTAALATARPDVEVHAQVPYPDRPNRFVTIERAGGPRRNLVVDAAMLSIEAWSDGAADAQDIAQLCRAVMHSLPGTTVSGVSIYRADEAGGPVHQPDPESGHERYTFAIQIAARGTAA